MSALLLLPKVAAAQLTVDELELFITPGASPTVRTVAVRNESNGTVQASVTIEDWDRDDHGTNRFFAAGSKPNSCAAGLEVFPKSLVLAPGEAANVRVSLTASANIPANCWSIVFLENLASRVEGGRQLSYNVRTGVKVYGESASAVRDGMIDAMSLTEATADRSATGTASTPRASDNRNDVVRPAVLVGFRNVGDVQLMVKGTIEVRRADNSVVHRADVNAFPVLPNQRRLIEESIPALPAGKYVLFALLDFGGSELVAGQLEYEVR